MLMLPGADATRSSTSPPGSAPPTRRAARRAADRRRQLRLPRHRRVLASSRRRGARRRASSPRTRPRPSRTSSCPTRRASSAAGPGSCRRRCADAAVARVGARSRGTARPVTAAARPHDRVVGRPVRPGIAPVQPSACCRQRAAGGCRPLLATDGAETAPSRPGRVRRRRGGDPDRQRRPAGRLRRRGQRRLRRLVAVARRRLASATSRHRSRHGWSRWRSTPATPARRRAPARLAARAVGRVARADADHGRGRGAVRSRWRRRPRHRRPGWRPATRRRPGCFRRDLALTFSGDDADGRRLHGAHARRPTARRRCPPARARATAGAGTRIVADVRRSTSRRRRAGACRCGRAAPSLVGASPSAWSPDAAHPRDRGRRQPGSRRAAAAARSAGRPARQHARRAGLLARARRTGRCPAAPTCARCVVWEVAETALRQRCGLPTPARPATTRPACGSRRCGRRTTRSRPADRRDAFRRLREVDGAARELDVDAPEGLDRHPPVRRHDA